MKTTPFLSSLAVLACLASDGRADLSTWLSAVSSGTSAIYQRTNIIAPTTDDIGTPTLTNGVAYEFIVNAVNGPGPSAALMGARNTGVGDQIGFKFDQWPNTSSYGVTEFGILDTTYSANVESTDVHLVYSIDESGSLRFYVNGVFSDASFLTTPVLAGTVGLGAAHDPINGDFDLLTGTIVGVAVYDSLLLPSEVAAHANAYFSTGGTCSGDGGDQMGCTNCPCGNNTTQGTIGGCINSAGTSCRLIQSGTASIAAMDLRFEAAGAPPQNSCQLTSGNALAPANAANPCFGTNSGIQSVNLDGLRCVVQGVLRHGVRPSDGNGDVGVTTNGWGSPNGFFNFAAFTVGSTKHFQIINRDDGGAVCLTGQNTSQAISVTFNM